MLSGTGQRLLKIPLTPYASAQTISGYNYSPWFDATGDDYQDISDSPALRLKQFSAASWFKTSANYYVNGLIVNKGGLGKESPGQNMNYGIWLTSEEKLKAGFESAGSTDYYVTYPNTFSDGKWHYVVVSYDGSALRLYLDGVQIAWRPITATPDTSGSQPLRIGANAQAQSGYFMGELDEVRVWNRAVSAGEVSDQYKFGTYDLTGLVAQMDGNIEPSPPPADTTPPTIIAPTDKLLEATGSLTQVNLGEPTVTDIEDLVPAVINDAPAEGFPVGTTTVTWTATDASGNFASDSQLITIIDESNSAGLFYTFCVSGCDYNNLQTAINSLPAEGGTIYISAGNYVMSNTITLKSNTVLEFSDQASIYFRGDTKPVFKGTGVKNIEIRGGDITAERTGVKAFSFTSAGGIKITGTKMTLVKGSNSNAFHCIDCLGAYVSNIDAKTATRLIDIKSSSKITDGKSSNIWIQHSIFDDSSIEGVKVNHSTDVHINNNTITNTAENGIDIGWNKNSEVVGNRLIRTGVPNGAAIHPDSANGANIINNYIDTTGGTAIPVYRASNINVIGNTIINAGDQGVSVITKLEPSSFVQVKSNHIISPTGFGIYESPSQYQVEIAYNIIEQMPAGINAIYVVWSNNYTTEVYDNTVR